MSTLSICIPVYNQNVTSLLEDLLQERKALQEDVEILVFEDGSAERMKRYNTWLREVPRLIYQDFRINVGRSVIRNKLAQAASGEYLLFLDDDSRFETPGFLQNYLQQVQAKSVVCGGREYTAKVPGPEYTLHWEYGRNKESRPAGERNKNPYESFHSNNFLVPKNIIMQHPFDASLTQYGHEDTLFGYELSKNNIPVKHINNPVIHAELDTNIDFLEKSKLAIQNLWELYQRKDVDFNRSVKLLKVYDRLKSTGMLLPVSLAFRATSFNLEQYLLYSRKPMLSSFSFYKLGYLATLQYRKDTPLPPAED